jgi:polygalacturonase
VKKSKLTDTQWKKLVASGGVLTPDQNTWYPSEKALKGGQNSNMNVPANLKTREDYEQVKDYLRPVMVSLVNCRKVLLDGPTFQNSPAWCLHPLMCEDITLRNLTVKNPWYSQNGDGLDLESCKNAIVYKCSFDVGDDAICFKSGKDADGRQRGKPTENAIVKDCIVYHGHGGFTVGSEMSGGIRNVHVSNCTFIGTDVGLRFKSTRGRGGVVEKVFISNVTMVNIPAEAILFDLYYSGGSPVPEPDEKAVDKAQLAANLPPVTEETPQFRDISIKNVTCKGAGRAVFLQGLPEMNLKNIRLENVTIDAIEGLECIDSDGIQLTTVRIKADKGPAMHFKNGRNVQIEGFRYQIPGKTAVKVEGALSENIRMKKADFGASDETIVLESNVKREALKLN